LKLIARERRMSEDDRDELQHYRSLLNQPFADTPLAQAAQ
jgi:hypothetical protein